MRRDGGTDVDTSLTRSFRETRAYATDCSNADPKWQVFVGWDIVLVWQEAGYLRPADTILGNAISRSCTALQLTNELASLLFDIAAFLEQPEHGGARKHAGGLIEASLKRLSLSNF